MESIILQGITPEELTKAIRQAIREELTRVQPSESKLTLFSREETAKQLHVSLPTLGEYVKRGLIKGSKVGTRVLFSEEAIREALAEIPTQKYRRR